MLKDSFLLLKDSFVVAVRLRTLREELFCVHLSCLISSSTLVLMPCFISEKKFVSTNLGKAELELVSCTQQGDSCKETVEEG